jgi:hypothetical protein
VALASDYSPSKVAVRSLRLAVCSWDAMRFDCEIRAQPKLCLDAIFQIEPTPGRDRDAPRGIPPPDLTIERKTGHTHRPGRGRGIDSQRQPFNIDQLHQSSRQEIKIVAVGARARDGKIVAALSRPGGALGLSANVSTARAQQKLLTADQTQIVNTVSTIFTAAPTDDVAKFDSVIASDFYIYDGGARFNGDAVMAMIKARVEEIDITGDHQGNLHSCLSSNAVILIA